MRRFVLVISLMLVLVSMLCVTREFEIIHASPYTDVDVDTAYNMITNGSYPDLVVLDVRTQSEYDSGHIYGAVWIPHTELEARISELAGHEDHEIIVYCLSGGRSVTASGILDSNNFTKVYNMLGGISAWQTADYPTWIATVHNVHTTFNYDTIQTAIDAPQTLHGHTIFVEEGKYYEHVIVNKSLSLVGENISTTVIDGNFSGNPVTIAASHVNMTSFTVQEAWLGIWYVFNGFGIYVAPGTSYNNISHNIITNNLMYGIMLNTSSHNIISDNIIRNNTGPGITIFHSSSNIISNNTILEGSGGIAVFFSSNNTIFENNVLNNSYGITLGISGYNRVFCNNMTSNYLNFGVYGYSKSDFNNSVGTNNLVDGKSVYYLQGVDDIVLDSQLNIGTLYLINCKNVTVKDLFLSNNSFGLLLWETRSSKIENLTVKDNGYGIHLILSTNITISGSYITNNVKGIWLNSSNVCSISGNNIEANDDRGIVLDLSSNNSILRNNITSNRCDGIVIAEGVGNYIFENSIVDNYHAVLLFSTSNNKFYHNNFVGKSPQILFIEPVYTDYWDNSVEGNYWSDYNGTDLDSNGIGDTPYFLYANNTDRYPLMGMFSSFNTSLGYDVNVISNSTIEDLEYFKSNSTIKMHVSNMTANQTYGFCRICIPHALMSEPFNVTIDGANPVYWNYTLCDDGENRWIYFSYQHSRLEIVIIPEFGNVFIVFLVVSISFLLIGGLRKRNDRLALKEGQKENKKN